MARGDGAEGVDSGDEMVQQVGEGVGHAAMGENWLEHSGGGGVVHDVILRNPKVYRLICSRIEHGQIQDSTAELSRGKGK